MRQIQQFRNGMSPSGQWFRIGMISATVVTPLLTRWREVRAAERARALWEARGGARWPFGPSERDLPPLARKSDISTRLWLAGVGFGLIAAGTAAFFIARRRLRAGEEAPLEIPLAGANGKSGESADHARAIFGRAAQPSTEETTGGETTAPALSAPRTRNATASAHDWRAYEPEGASPRESGPGAAAGTAPYIGNIHTRVYHEGDAPNLPAEDNRIYFASAAEAEAAGYHLDHGEKPSSGV